MRWRAFRRLRSLEVSSFEEEPDSSSDEFGLELVGGSELRELGREVGGTSSTCTEAGELNVKSIPPP